MFNAPRSLVYIVNVVTSLIEGLLGLRITLKFLSASSNAPLVKWVYQTSEPLLTPFIGMFPSPQLQGGFVIEFSVLFAFIFYSLIGYLITQILETLIKQADEAKEHGKKQ